MLGLRARPAPAQPLVSLGRRREALLRHHAEREKAQRLSASDVEALATDRSAASRAAVATKLGRQFDELTASSERDLAAAVLELLVRDVEKEVRRGLAQAVAASPNLPPITARRLAEDDIEVAGPILERSPVLTDEDLLRVVRTNAMQYALAVAGRERLSEAVSEALVATEEQEVVSRVVGNSGAALSDRTLRRIIEDYRADADVQARLIRRPELPHEVVEQIVRLVGERLEWELVRERQMAPEEARLIMNGVRERAAIGFTAREHSDRILIQRLRERHDAGRLTHEDLLRCLKQGEIAALELGFAVHAKLDPARVRRLLYHQDRRHVAALCVAAGFGTPHYIMLRMALDLAEAAMQQDGKSPRYTAETVRYLQVQYERLRRDETKLHELIRG